MRFLAALFILLGPACASGGEAAVRPSVAQVFAFPNPARRQTTIRFVLEGSGLEARVRIFDIAGGLVKELTGAAMTTPEPGLTHAAWDLTNDSGQAVAAGVYLFELTVRGPGGPAAKVIKKLAVVR